MVLRDEPFALGALLQSDMRGEEVSDLQRNLSVLGYPLAVTGVFDDTTYVAVRQFQQDQGLTVDGIVGPETSAAILRALTAQAPTVPMPPSGPAAYITTPIDLTQPSAAAPVQASIVGSGKTLLYGGLAVGAIWWFFLRK